jgi:hypothetical protein
VKTNGGSAPATAPMKDFLQADEHNRWRLEAKE